MGKKDKRVDDYITKVQPFARPILTHLRELIHKTIPDIEETIKWGMPAFEYKGPCMGMASFKQHAVFGFWKSALMKDPKGYLWERANKGGEAMGNFGRITSLESLPPDKVIIDFIKQAKKLNDDGVKVVRERKDKPLDVPDYLSTALKRNKPAKTTFDTFSTSKKRDYIEWLTGAKTKATREKRLDQALEWMAEGKSRNWKYEKK